MLTLFNTIVTWLRGLRYTKHVLFAVIVAVSLLIAWLFGLHQEWFLVAALLAISVGIYALIKRRSRRTSNRRAVTPLSDDTAELPIIVENEPPADFHKGRRLVVDTAGNTLLVVDKITTTRRHVLSKPVRTTSRTQTMLSAGHLVNKRVAKRSSFEPLETESEIKVFLRLQWFSHAPKQILVAVCSVILLGALLVGFTQSVVSPGWTLVGLLATVIVAAGLYLWVWIPWAYQWLIVTNERALLIYDPPLWLNGWANTTEFGSVTLFNERDQHGFVNWCLAKLGQTQYGIIQGDTPAQDGDEWIRNGVRYVPHFKDIKRVLDGQLAAFQQTQSEQHEEDMDFQRRQAEAIEATAVAAVELRDMVKQLTSDSNGF